MKCSVCERTIPPVQARSFACYNVCKGCYDSLGLKNVRIGDIEPLSLLPPAYAIESLPLSALVGVASTFDKTGMEALVHRFAMTERDAHSTLAFLLSVKALQLSPGTAPLTTAGELALFFLAEEATYEVIDSLTPPLSEDPSVEGLVLSFFEANTTCLTLCEEMLDSMEPFPYADSVRELVKDMQLTIEEDRGQAKIDLSKVEEGMLVECSEVVSGILSTKYGDEHVFSDWEEFCTTFRELEPFFGLDGHYISVPDTPLVPVHLLVGDGELYLTARWEELTAVFLQEDFTAFLAMLEDDLPLFVFEKAAGGLEPLEKFMGKALPANADNVDLILLYEDVLEKGGKPEEAFQFIEKKVAEMPDNVSVLTAMGMRFSKKSQFEKAIEFFEKAALHSEKMLFPTLIEIIGASYEVLGEHEKAAETYDRLVERAPGDFLMMSGAARLKRNALMREVEELIEGENYGEALSLVEKHIDPVEVTPYYFFKGVILSREGEAKAALGLLTDYVDVFSEDEEGWMEKAALHMQLGQLPAAAHCFRKCADLMPEDVEFRVLEALCYKQMGHTRHYKRCINEARKVDAEKTKEVLKKYNV